MPKIPLLICRLPGYAGQIIIEKSTTAIIIFRRQNMFSHLIIQYHSFPKVHLGSRIVKDQNAVFDVDTKYVINDLITNILT